MTATWPTETKNMLFISVRFWTASNFANELHKWGLIAGQLHIKRRMYGHRKCSPCRRMSQWQVGGNHFWKLGSHFNFWIHKKERKVKFINHYVVLICAFSNFLVRSIYNYINRKYSCCSHKCFFKYLGIIKLCLHIRGFMLFYYMLSKIILFN